MSRIGAFFAWLWARTIWARGAIPASELKYAGPLKRVFLPLYDVAAVAAGVAAVRSGIPAIDDLMPDAIANWLGRGFILAAWVCLAGIIFPRLHLAEIAGKCILFGYLGVYFVALRTLADVTDTGTRDFVSVIVLMASIIILFRLWILGTEGGARRLAKKQAAAAIAAENAEADQALSLGPES